MAIGALSLRALFAAYPRSDDPREREGVVAVDDIEVHQDPSLLRGVVSLLRRALPNVQWLLSTSSTRRANACAPGEVVVLRRSAERAIEINERAALTSVAQCASPQLGP